MTQRERLATRAVSDPAPRSGTSLALRAPPAAPCDPNPSWEELFHAASPAQQVELLAQAERHGILYRHRLPAQNVHPPGEAPRRLLDQVLAGQTDGLASFTPSRLPCADGALDEAQREAVARAGGSPDYFLIQGLPGTGKSRVIGEIITQAALRGERVLLLAPNAPAIDRVLEEIGGREPLLALRCLGRHERADELPPGVPSLTLAERLRQLTAAGLPAARAAVERAEQRCQRLERDGQLLADLRRLADRRIELEGQIAAVNQQAEQAAVNVAAEANTLDTAAGEFRAALEALRADRQQAGQRLDAALAEVQQQLAEQQQRQKELEPELARLVPLADAKRHHRWWSSAWWQATLGGGDPLGMLADLESRGRQCEAALGDLDVRRAKLTEELAQAEDVYQASRRQVCQAEAERRQAEFQQRRATLTTQLQGVDEAWRTVAAQLTAEQPAPQPADITAALAAWQAQSQQAAADAAFAQEWARTLAASLAEWPARLLAQANVVAATTGALAADEHFGEAGNCSFDLLILDEAHLVGESELLQAAGRARRWVLVGEPDWPGAATEPARRPGMPPASRPFHRLWQATHCDPRQLPAAWVQEDGRWCCRLRPLTAEQRRQLECERVADCAEIELRILALPRAQPALAEVVFPAAMSIAQCKQYLFGELQELPVQASGDCFHWSEGPDRLVLRLSETPEAAPIPVPLAAGVRELVSTAAGTNGAAIRPGHTCCLEFDRSAGWDRAGAGDWVHRHLGVLDLGRTAQLSVAHRMHPDLAAFLGDLFAGHAYRLPAGDGHGAAGPAAEFVAVPGGSATLEPARPPDARRAENGRRATAVAAPRPVKGGAGLEIDLGEPRQRERLPAAVRGILPPRGLVNWAEAQAVVTHLEALARQTAPANGCGAPSVGVMALYAAQAELLRWLVRQSTVLAAGPLDVRVGLPYHFAQQECATALVSLTRSHTHRAVAFGDGPPALAMALTRARGRLVLFGDVGTLARRAQWESAVEHLDEAAAARERELIRRLLRYVQGQGAHPRAFHLREGACP